MHLKSIAMPTPAGHLSSRPMACSRCRFTPPLLLVILLAAAGGAALAAKAEEESGTNPMAALPAHFVTSSAGGSAGSSSPSSSPSPGAGAGGEKKESKGDNNGSSKEKEKGKSKCVTTKDCHLKRLVCAKKCTMAAHHKCAAKCSRSCTGGLPICT